MNDIEVLKTIHRFLGMRYGVIHDLTDAVNTMGVDDAVSHDEMDIDTEATLPDKEAQEIYEFIQNNKHPGSSLDVVLNKTLRYVREYKIQGRVPVAGFVKLKFTVGAEGIHATVEYNGNSESLEGIDDLEAYLEVVKWVKNPFKMYI